MFPNESEVLRAIDTDRRWCEHIDAAFDVPGIYLHLMVFSLRRRGLIRRAWFGGYSLTREGRDRMLADSS